MSETALKIQMAPVTLELEQYTGSNKEHIVNWVAERNGDLLTSEHVVYSAKSSLFQRRKNITPSTIETLDIWGRRFPNIYYTKESWWCLNPTYWLGYEVKRNSFIVLNDHEKDILVTDSSL